MIEIGHNNQLYIILYPEKKPIYGIYNYKHVNINHANKYIFIHYTLLSLICNW